MSNTATATRPQQQQQTKAQQPTEIAKVPQQSNPLAEITDKTVLPIPALRTLLGNCKTRVADSLPIIKASREEKLTTAARLIVSYISEVQKPKSKLPLCSAPSHLKALVRISQLGLEIGGDTKEMWVIPRWNKEAGCLEAQAQLGYMGVVKLALRHKDVKSVRVDSVRKGDVFKVVSGMKPDLIHEYADPRGDITAVYCIVRMRDGDPHVTVMTKDQVDEHRRKHSEFGSDDKGDPAGSWAKGWEGMALKTVVIRGCKFVPKSVAALELEELDGELPAADVVALTAAEQAAPQLTGGVEGEVEQEGPKEKTEVTMADLEMITAVIAEREDSEGSDIEFECCEPFGQQAFAQLTEKQRLDAFKILERRAGK